MGHRKNNYSTIIQLYPRVKFNEIDKNYSKLNSTGIFFSPFIYFDKMKFDHIVDQKRHKVFNEIFREIYSSDFNIDIITDDDNLRKLIIDFHKEVFYDDELNPLNQIGGNIFVAKYTNGNFTEPEFIELSD